MTPANGNQTSASATGRTTRPRASASGRMDAAARVHRRRWLRQAGLKLEQLDAVAISYLDGWARAIAAGEHGAARLNLRDLAARLSVLGLDEHVRMRGAVPGNDAYDTSRLNAHERAVIAEAESILWRLEREA
jgi:hypothetical protein